MYSSTLPSTSALGGGGWSAPRPDRFTPGKESRYPLYRRLGGPQGWFGRVRKISPPPGFDPRTVQVVASDYTGCAIGPPPPPFRSCHVKQQTFTAHFSTRLRALDCPQSPSHIIKYYPRGQFIIFSRW